MRYRDGGAAAVLAFLIFCSPACSLSRGALGGGRDAARADVGALDLGVEDAGPGEDMGIVDDAGDDASDDVGTDSGSDGGNDAGGSPRLDLFTGGTFSRASEGSYLTGPATDGTTAFLAWAPPNVRRIEDRGDGLGPMLLIEGSRTNFVLQSRQITDSSVWSSAGTATVTADAAPGPDAAVEADRSTAAGPYTYSAGQVLNGVAPNPHSISAYARAISSSSEWRTDYRIQAWSGPVPTTWTRRDRAFGPGGTWFATNSFDEPSGYGLFVDLHQLEQDVFPSSVIRTTTSPMTRAPDVLAFSGPSLPPELATGGFTIVYAPDCSSLEMTQSGLPHPLLGSDASNELVLQPDGTTVRVILVTQGSTTVGAASSLTFSRGQPMTFVVRPSAGTITVTGATTGDGTITGTPGSLVGATFFVGSDGAHAAFGRFGASVTVP